MKKLMTFALTSTLSIAMLTGCSKDTNISNGVTPPPETSTQTSETEGSNTTSESSTYVPVTVTHEYGTVTITELPKRVAVFDIGTLDSMDALGVEAEYSLPVSSVPEYLSEYANAINAGSIKEPDIEALFEFQPDLIIISGRQADFYEDLNQIAPTIYVNIDVTNYIEDFRHNVSYLAEIFQKNDVVNSYLDEIDSLISTSHAVASASDQKALILLTNDGSMSAYGPGSRFGLIHDVLGIKTIDESIAVSTHGQEASYEYIAQMNPDILYVVDRTAVAGGSNSAQATLDNDLVNSTTAAAQGKIIFLDPEKWYISSGGITSVTDMITEAMQAFN